MLISSVALGRKIPDLPADPDGIAARLLAAGLEVEEITPLGEPGSPLPDALPVDGYMVRIAGVEGEEALDAALLGGGAREVQIDVFADLACPWCYIAERRLEQVLAERNDLRVVWRWRPYQLQSGIPAAGLPWAEFVAQKFGADAAAAFEHVTGVGAGDGLEFRFDQISRAPNTGDAHRLVLLAARSGRAREAARALFEEHFTRGGNLSDREVLIGVGERIGLDGVEVRASLEGEAGEDELRESQSTAARLGIAGVPFYIFNGRIAVSGAQDRATFTRAIEMSLQASEEEG